LYGCAARFGNRIAAIGAICRMVTDLQIVAVIPFPHNEIPTSGQPINELRHVQLNKLDIDAIF
jgi:hypothetical protein